MEGNYEETVSVTTGGSVSGDYDGGMWVIWCGSGFLKGRFFIGNSSGGILFRRCKERKFCFTEQWRKRGCHAFTIRKCR